MRWREGRCEAGYRARDGDVSIQTGVMAVYPSHLDFRFSGCLDLGAGQGGNTQAYHPYGKYF
jgi:hypothetical protein